MEILFSVSRRRFRNDKNADFRQAAGASVRNPVKAP